MTVTGSGLSDPGTARATVEEVMAGFIVWLDRQDLPAKRRNRYHGATGDELRVAQTSLKLLEQYLTTSYPGWI